MKEMIFFLLAAGAMRVSFDGEEYTADENGVVEVPEEAREVLTSHGHTECGKPKSEDPVKARILELTTVIKAAKETLKTDKGNADFKAAVEAAEKALDDFKAEQK